MLIGDRGPGVVLDARTCAVLEAYAGVRHLRTLHRGQDPHLDRQLAEIKHAADLWQTHVDRATRNHLGSADGSASGPTVDAAPEPDRPSPWLTTSQVAVLLRVEPRTVVKAIDRGSLPARKAGRQWQIHTDDVEHYRQARRERQPR
ncbi:helix-turn-helix domain-containing protein [Nocardioides bruguierae]|uniref:Helix-turn-helix domain-containing protein n=1 Tax=Nocardioides bruguierae TaxID=2945102 RepID=A0A9X2DBS4_9ACTN|nr:helix-turn-helix domain-containing protein [Nocardioides bruguierae]MCM0622846.1 helix-turn-helix domain-containing protein [Nocardioides bruguierae]